MNRKIVSIQDEDRILLRQSSGTRPMWQGLQTITDYKRKPSRELPSDASIPDELHAFYARFEEGQKLSMTGALMHGSVLLASKYVGVATESMVTTKHIYDTNRKAIVKTHVFELKYVEFAEGLAWNLTSLRKRLVALSRKLKEQ